MTCLMKGSRGWHGHWRLSLQSLQLHFQLCCASFLVKAVWRQVPHFSFVLLKWTSLFTLPHEALFHKRMAPCPPKVQ